MTPAPRIGTEFAGYRIDGLLGRGGMGVVYRAEHPRLGASIALKVMAPDLAMDEGFRERFVREARIVAEIKHPNIVPIYDAGEWQGDLYIAMRYIEGDDLRALLRARGVIQPEEACAIGVQIASALDAAHRSNVVHRDVKPGNILLDAGAEPDSPPIAFLSDLGLGKRMGAQNSVTSSGELIGTIDYMAPEQISGSPIDGRADVYSLACVLFECLAGSAPYVRENKAAVLWAHLNDEVPRASESNPSLPKTIDEVLARGMAKQPEDRFGTARDLVTALLGSLASAPPRRGMKRARFAPLSGARAVALGVAVAVFLGGAAASRRWFSTRAASLALPVPQSEASRPRRAPTRPGLWRSRRSTRHSCAMSPPGYGRVATTTSRLTTSMRVSRADRGDPSTRRPIATLAAGNTSTHSWPPVG